MIDTKKLRRLAQAATPGPWEFWHGWVATNIERDGGVVIAERPTPSGGKYQSRVDSNFKFIAAANPAAISELLDRLEAAEKERDKYKLAYSLWREKTDWVQEGINSGAISPKYLGWHRADVTSDLLKKAEKERDALRTELKETWHRAAAAENTIKSLQAKIEHMERQEPVWFIDERGEPKRYHKSKADYCKYGGLDLLYTLPGAKGEKDV